MDKSTLSQDTILNLIPYMTDILSPYMKIKTQSSQIDSISHYWQTSNISHTLVGNKIVDHSDVVAALPVGTVPTTSSFLTLTWLQLIGQRQLQD